MCRYIVCLYVLLLTLGVDALSQKVKVRIHTNMGDMVAMLYDDTPKHRNEFIKLVQEKHFDGTLFYRVVRNFVVQGGSSDSKNAKPGQHIGYGDEADNIDSEFSKKRFHKFGALCAPRQPDKVNMLKTSDISQFYIVRGQVVADSVLTLMEKRVNNPIKKKLHETYHYPYKERLAELKATDKKAYNDLAKEIKEKIDFEYRISDHLEFTKEQREAYTTIGGTPDLDGEYTVFGELISGFDVLRKISNLKVDKNDRPVQDVRMTITIED